MGLEAIKQQIGNLKDGELHRYVHNTCCIVPIFAVIAALAVGIFFAFSAFGPIFAGVAAFVFCARLSAEACFFVDDQMKKGWFSFS